jgi:hypothetical protein
MGYGRAAVGIKADRSGPLGWGTRSGYVRKAVYAIGLKLLKNG